MAELSPALERMAGLYAELIRKGVSQLTKFRPCYGHVLKSC